MKYPIFKVAQLILFLFFVNASVSAQETTWATQADHLRGQNGIRYAFNCPPGGAISKTPWGTDVYTDDSPVCPAAVHAGLISLKNGGRVLIEIRAGAQSYKGTTRNGVTSHDYGGWHGSYVFIKEDDSLGNVGPTAIPIKWDTRADGWRGQNGDRFLLECPSGGSLARSVWGTDLYTDDSGICVAAVHAGLITMTNGGVFTIEIRAGAKAYTGSTKRGVTTSSYGEWKGSFVFIKP